MALLGVDPTTLLGSMTLPGGAIRPELDATREGSRLGGGAAALCEAAGID
jgi:hypothetical protein